MSCIYLNPIRPGLFSHSPGPGGGVQTHECQKSVLTSQLIEMKLGMGHYGHKSIPDANIEFGSSFSFRDLTSQNLPQKKGTSHQIRLFTLGKRVQLKKKEFLCLESFFSTQN